MITPKHDLYACVPDGPVGLRGARSGTAVPDVSRGWRPIIAIGAVVLCATAWSGTALAMSAAQKSACATVLTLRGWHPPLSLAGDVSDSQAVSLLRDHLRWQQTVVTSTRLNEETARIKNTLWDAVRDFNLSGLYRKLPSERGDWRSVTLRGDLTPRQYRVARIAPGAFDQPLSSLGATTSQLAMRPRPRPTPDDGPRGDRYELRARLRANVGPIAWDNVLQAAWMGLDHLTTTVPLPAPSGGGFFGGTGSDAEILLQLQPAFPHLYDWYLGIADIPDVLAGDSARSRAQHLQMTVQLNDGLRKRYPKVADYVAQVKDFISADVTIQNDAGRWLNVDLDSSRERLTIDAWVLDGHFVPSREGVPQLDAIDTDVSLDQLVYQSVINVRLKALGVTVELNDWPIDWQYRRVGQGAGYSGRITQQPRIHVRGAALGFIPTGVVDAMIPSNIEGIVADFMQVLTHSNDGDGARLGFEFADGSDSGSVVSANAQGNLLDNFFVHFAVSLVNQRIIPNSAQFEGLKQLANDGLTAIIEDTDGLVAAQGAARDRDLEQLIEQCRAAP